MQVDAAVDIRQLRYFVTIIDEGSFSRAAYRLHVAQPALSQHVRNMEAELGVELLFRSPQGIRATESGEMLARHARSILEQMEIARQDVRQGVSEPEGVVRFGMPGTVAQLLCLPLISEARRRYPKIKLCVAEAMSGFVLDWLRDGKTDVGILYREATDRTLAARHILSEDLYLIGSSKFSGERFAQGEPVSFLDVAGLPLILPSGSHGLRDLIEERALIEDVRLNTVIDIDTYSQIKLLVADGLGYSILPKSAVLPELRGGTLTAHLVGLPTLSRDLHLVCPSSRPRSNATRVIEALAHSILVRLVEDGVWPARLAPPGDGSGGTRE